jgi:hypothetical protein
MQANQMVPRSQTPVSSRQAGKGDWLVREGGRSGEEVHLMGTDSQKTGRRYTFFRYFIQEALMKGFCSLPILTRRTRQGKARQRDAFVPSAIIIGFILA